MKAVVTAFALAGSILSVSSNGATPVTRVGSYSPDFTKSCITWCGDCAPPWNGYLYTGVSTDPNSLLDSMVDCPHQFLGPCSTFGNCSGGGSAPEASVGSGTVVGKMAARDYENVWNAATAGNVAELKRLMAVFRDRVSVNSKRQALQVRDCGGVLVAYSIPLTAEMLERLTD